MMYINVRDYPSVAEAISACSYGGRLYFPADEKIGPYRPPDSGGWIINKPIEIFGDGRVNESVGLGYFIDPVRGTADSTILNLKVGANHVYLHDICLSAPSPWPVLTGGTGDAIRFDQPGAVIWGLCLEQVGILYAGRHGIYAAPTDTPESVGYCVAPHIRYTTVYGSGSHGVVLRNNTAVSFDHLYPTQNKGTGLWAHSINGSIVALASEGNGWSLNDPLTQASCLYIEDSAALSIRGMHLEDFGHSVVKTAMMLKNVKGSSIDGNLFEAPGERGLYMQNCKANVIGANAHYGLKVSLEMDDACTGNTVFPQHHESWGADQLGSVIVPKNKKNLFFPSTKPNENMAAGVALPEVNGTSEISNPRNGMLIYDQKAGRLKFYHNGKWRTVSVS